MHRFITYAPHALRQSPPVFVGLRKEFGEGWLCSPIRQMEEGTLCEGLGMA